MLLEEFGFWFGSESLRFLFEFLNCCWWFFFVVGLFSLVVVGMAGVVMGWYGFCVERKC
jgi:hypothetical protein